MSDRLSKERRAKSGFESIWLVGPTDLLLVPAGYNRPADYLNNGGSP
jgi:hypothetical protein